MKPNILGVIGPGFLNQVPTLSLNVPGAAPESAIHCKLRCFDIFASKLLFPGSTWS